MKLHHNPASPFVRMVMVTAHEAGLADRIDPVSTGRFVPVEPHTGVVADSPLGKIPTMVTADGEPLYDSRVICEFITSMAPETGLLPAEGLDRWRCLTLQALAQGIADAAVNLRYETTQRPEEMRWPEWIAGQRGKISRSLDVLETIRFDELSAINVGTIGVAVCLGYLDFRFPDDDWRESHPKLAAWYAEFAQRPSMQATVAHELS